MMFSILFNRNIVKPFVRARYSHRDSLPADMVSDSCNINKEKEDTESMK